VDGGGLWSHVLMFVWETAGREISWWVLYTIYNGLSMASYRNECAIPWPASDIVPSY
jgi:hypothetical protein